FRSHLDRYAVDHREELLRRVAILRTVEGFKHFVGRSAKPKAEFVDLRRRERRIEVGGPAERLPKDLAPEPLLIVWRVALGVVALKAGLRCNLVLRTEDVID